MKDFLGNDLFVGDTVVFVESYGKDLRIGTINKLNKFKANVSGSQKEYKFIVKLPANYTPNNIIIVSVRTFHNGINRYKIKVDKNIPDAPNIIGNEIMNFCPNFRTSIYDYIVKDITVAGIYFWDTDESIALDGVFDILTDLGLNPGTWEKL